MKTFFNKIIYLIRSLFNGYASKHQKVLSYGTLVLALLFGMVTGVLPSVLLASICALIFEFVYCFVPLKQSKIFNRWFQMPDFKEFKNNVEKYIITPKHELKENNFWFIMIGLLMFIVIKLVILLF